MSITFHYNTFTFQHFKDSGNSDFKITFLCETDKGKHTAKVESRHCLTFTKSID